MASFAIRIRSSSSWIIDALNTFNDMPAVWSFANPRYVSGVGYVKRGCIDVLVRIPTDGDSTINCERCSGDET